MYSYVAVVYPHHVAGVLPYFEVTGHPAPVSSLGVPTVSFGTVGILLSFKHERAIQGQLPRVLLPMIGGIGGWFS